MRKTLLLVVFLVTAGLLVACGSDDGGAPRSSQDSGGDQSDSAGSGTGGRAQPVERLIVREGELSLTVDDVAAVAERLEDLAAEFGGRVQSSYIQGDVGEETGSASIRVPVGRFEDLIDAAKGLAIRVISELTKSEDVTEEFVDLDAQARNLRATELQFQVVMEQATTVSDILRVQSELTDVRAEIERLDGRMQYFERSAAESVVLIRLSPVKNEAPLVNEGWSFTETGKSAIRGLTGALQGITDVAVYVGVFAPIWGVLLVLGLWGRRRGWFRNTVPVGTYGAPRRPVPPSSPEPPSTPSEPSPPEIRSPLD